MNCRRVSRRLSAYIEDSLSPGEKAGFEEHLKNCVLCQRKLADIKLIIQSTSQLEQKTPGPHFVNRLLCAVDNQKSSKVAFKGWRYRFVLPGVAFAIAASLTFFAIGPENSSVPVPVAADKSPANVTETVDSIDEHKGFPVSGEALRRDMALNPQLKPDSTKQDSIVLPKHYVRPVGIKKGKKDNITY